MFKRFKNNEKGFTLMEIVIVIVILGILALLAIPRLLGFTEQAEIASDKEYAAVVARAAELFDATHSKDLVPPETSLENIVAAELVDDESSLQYDTGTVTIIMTGGIAEVTIDYDSAVDPAKIVYTSSGANKGYALE